MAVKAPTIPGQNKHRRSTGDRIADFIITAILVLLTIAVVFPFYNMLLVSLAKYEDIISTPLYIFPKAIDLQNYRMAVLYPHFINSVGVSLFVTVVGTGSSLLTTTMGAYALSRKYLPFRKILFYFIVITMYFGGGLIPWYLVMKSLGFVDSMWVMIVPPMINTFYLILMRNYFEGIPDDMEESAKIDGANDIQILFRIMIPLASPIIATIALFYAVARWNDWWLPMIFIQDPNKIPLTLILRRMVVDATIDLGNDMMNAMRDAHIQVHSRSLQMATVTLTTIPILLVYPFLQKYFTKGIMLGAIKA
ncbi:MAG: carbohydrate ABC transporter permease [Anaerolineae bacterium]|nr:carbohydrate ABC transporter permease [Anaerolineae bacterium]